VRGAGLSKSTEGKAQPPPTLCEEERVIPDVPFIKTPEPVARRMLELSRLRVGETLYDLGSGDGIILILAARDFGARAVGIEVREDLVQKSRRKVRELGLDGLVKVIQGDFFDIPLSEANVVTLYLLTKVNADLKPKLEKELRASARIVSHDYRIPGWNLAKGERMSSARMHSILLYRSEEIQRACPVGRLVRSLLCTRQSTSQIRSPGMR